MSEKEFPNEYENLRSEDVSKELEDITNKTKESHNSKAHVRTFAKDVAEQMKGSNASVIKVALAEQGRAREYQTIVKKSKHQQILFLALTFVFVVGGAVSLGLALKQKNSTVPVPTLNQQKANSIVFSEQQTVLSSNELSRSELIASIQQSIGFVKDLGITNIILTSGSGTSLRALTASEFLVHIAPNLPPTMPNILGTDFMFGVDGDHDYSLFLIVKHTNFDSMVSLMREWEPLMTQDIARLLAIQTGGLDIFSETFNSEIIFNKESRVLRDDNQGFVVGYTFVDRTTVVLSTNPDTITEIIRRYSIQAIQ